jgi:hypothetical protein
MNVAGVDETLFFNCFLRSKQMISLVILGYLLLINSMNLPTLKYLDIITSEIKSESQCKNKISAIRIS